jgi:hypothetical protein
MAGSFVARRTLGWENGQYYDSNFRPGELVVSRRGKMNRFCRICWRTEPAGRPMVPGKPVVAVVKDLIHACDVPISINVQLQTILPFPPS